LGLFIGRFGRERAFIVNPRGHQDMRIPTDILGLNLIKYDGGRQDGRWHIALTSACRQCLERMRKLGPNPEKVIDVFRQSQPSDLLDSKKILADKDLDGWSFLAIKDDICNARTDIVVSSDDNHFRAEGGVSQRILQKVGQDVRRQLDYFKAQGFRQGQVVITTGGDWNRRAVIHAVVYDIEDYRFPTAELVRTLTRRILESAVALGARSIALPILGNGHARGPVESSDLVQAIASATLEFMNGRNCILKRVALYMLNEKDADSLPREIKGTRR
jgi:O-acetyl-ADP-ribose deacetylase (regulator of RNase III)